MISSFSKYWGMTGGDWVELGPGRPGDGLRRADRLRCARRCQPSMRRSRPSPRSPTARPTLRSQPSPMPGRLCWLPSMILAGPASHLPMARSMCTRASVVSSARTPTRSRGARRCWRNMVWRSPRAPTSTSGTVAPRRALPRRGPGGSGSGADPHTALPAIPQKLTLAPLPTGVSGRYRAAGVTFCGNPRRGRTYKLFSRLGKSGGTLGCGWPGAPTRRRRTGPSPLADVASRSETNAPEGGGTTQRGDPAPGPMRCGTTASGDERMHQ